jgi:hypothetical protein
MIGQAPSSTAHGSRTHDPKTACPNMHWLELIASNWHSPREHGGLEVHECTSSSCKSLGDCLPVVRFYCKLRTCHQITLHADLHANDMTVHLTRFSSWGDKVPSHALYEVTANLRSVSSTRTTLQISF